MSRFSAATAAAQDAAAPRHAVRRAPARSRAAGSPFPRRVSGPKSGAATIARPATRRMAMPTPAFGGGLALPRPSVPTFEGAGGRLLDRFLRGRIWIALVGALLLGLVGMQVSMLKLNSGIGRAVEHSSTLERQNASLRAEISRLARGERIQAAAQRLGLILPAAGEIHYLNVRRGRDASSAVQVMTAPDPGQRELAVAQAQAQAQADAQAQAKVQAATPTPTPATAPTTAQTTAPAAQPQQAAPAANGQQQASAPAQQGGTAGAAAAPPDGQGGAGG